MRMCFFCKAQRDFIFVYENVLSLRKDCLRVKKKKKYYEKGKENIFFAQ